MLGKFVAVCDYRVEIGFGQGLEGWVRVLGDTGDSSVLCDLMPEEILCVCFVLLLIQHGHALAAHCLLVLLLLEVIYVKMQCIRTM